MSVPQQEPPPPDGMPSWRAYANMLEDYVERLTKKVGVLTVQLEIASDMVRAGQQQQRLLIPQEPQHPHEAPHAPVVPTPSMRPPDQPDQPPTIDELIAKAGVPQLPQEDLYGEGMPAPAGGPQYSPHMGPSVLPPQNRQAARAQQRRAAKEKKDG